MKARKSISVITGLFLLLILVMASTKSTFAATKDGLIKEDGVYHYYESGKMVKKQWVFMKEKRYYFDKNGEAAVGSFKISGQYYVFNKNGKLCSPDKTSIIRVNGNDYRVNKEGEAVPGWNKKKTQYCKKNGLLCKGINVIKDKFYVFSAKGNYKAAKTKALRKVAKRDKSAKKLLALLGKPVKKQKYSYSCYRFDVAGHDEIYYYDHFELSLFVQKSGAITLEDYMPR